MKVLSKLYKKSKSKKGFTLVELIVVLVILAILAAILVPALLGYIDEARDKQVVLDAKSVYTATQAQLSELYAEGLEWSISSGNLSAGGDTLNASIQQMADVGVATADNNGITFLSINGSQSSGSDTTSHTAYNISTMEFVLTIGAEGETQTYTCTLANDDWEIE